MVSNSTSTRLTESPDDQSDQICPHLGRCDDPGSLYAFPTIENCCHSISRPVPVELSYQVDHCLGDDWSECPRYTEVLASGSSTYPILASAGKTILQSPTAWLFLLVAVMVVAVLTAVWFLALRPKDVPEVSMMTPAETTAAAPLASSEPGAVITQTATQTTTRTPTATASPASTPSRTPIPTASPTATQTPTWTPSPTPTVTPSTTPSPTPSPTPSMTPAPTRVMPRPTIPPTSTPTPLPTPELLSPEDGQAFSANDEIVLRWDSVGVLPGKRYYVITVAFSHLGETWYDDTPWTKDTEWTLSEHDYLVDLSDDGRFQWSVQVMWETGLDADGKPTGIAISPSSETWSLIWHSSGGPPSPPTPTPPPP